MTAVGIITGTGVGSLTEEVGPAMATPYGLTSSGLGHTTWNGVDVFHLSRHGEGRRFDPSDIPFRANAIALHELGVETIIATHAVGGLDPALHPGDLVVCDQLIDRTRGRPDTVRERLSPHTAFAEPFCPDLRNTLIKAAQSVDVSLHEYGTIVVIEGPRFSTRAESLVHRSDGGTVINMTAYPEAMLARELGICYASLAYITDMDAGTRPGDEVTHEQVLAGIRLSADKVRVVLAAAVGERRAASECRCAPATIRNPDRLEHS